MASNVNIKFVAILSSSLLLLAVLVAGAAYVTLTKSGEDHIIEGDRYMAAGDYSEASKSYSKAVNENVTKIEWLEKWRGALLNTIPETDLEYSQAYNDHYIGILRRLASLQPNDPDAQRDMLEATYQQVRLGGGSQNWTNFLNSCNAAYENMNDFSSPEAKQLYRYRGFAQVALMPLVSVTQDEHDQAIEDLETAFEADPTDIEALIQLSNVHRIDWLQALNANRPAAMAKALEAYRGMIDRVLEEFPGHPRAIALDTDYKIETELRKDATYEAQRQTRIALAGVAEPMIENFLTCDPELLEPDLLISSLSYGRSLWNVRPDDYVEIGLEITERALATRPDDFQLMMFRGSQLTLAGEYDRAEELLLELTELPDLPISLDGIRLKSSRVQAYYQLASNSIAKWNTLPDGDEKEAALATAATYSARLTEELTEDNIMSLMIEGQLAMAEQRTQEAVSILQDLNVKTNGDNIAVIRMLSKALADMGTLGAAMDQYNKWIELDPRNPAPLLDSAQIELQLRNPEGAIARLEAASQLLPDNEEIRKQINTLQVSTLGSDADLEISDPVIALMMRAESVAKAQGEGGLAEGIALLQEAVDQSPNDARPLGMLVEYLARNGDTEAALAAAEKGQELLPGNETFNRYAAMLRSGDRGEIAERYIDESGDPEPVRLIKKYALNNQMDKPERAQAFLDEAEARFPTNPTVLDTLFVLAMQNGDMAKARSVAALAAEHNADQCDGLLYQARLNIREENFEAAQNSLQLAVEKAPFSPQAWRLFGQVLLRTGRIEEAVESLARANEYKPDDAEISKTYASTLVQLTRLEQALEVVRAARRFTQSDANLNEMWLALESQVGDAESAIEYRKAMYASAPDDAANTRVLISLLTAQGEFDEANEMIQTSMESGKTDLGLLVIQANWYAEQGDVDQGERLIRSYIEDIDPSERTEAPYLALGNFLLQGGLNDKAIAAYQEGAAFQSPEMMTADRRLGDYYFGIGQYEEALASYKKVTDAGADTTGIVAKRVIETLQRLERWDEADQQLGSLAAGGGDDMQTLLLRAEIAQGRGDSRTAHELVNQAVEAAPNKPEPFIRRAQLDFNNPERLSFVLSDLEQAIRLAPTAMQPRHMRADVLIRNGRSAEAISELRRGIEAIPSNSELRRMLIQELWQSGRHDEAHAEARAAIEADDENPVWLMVAGDIASRDNELRNNWEIARGYFARAYEIDRTVALALRLANSCLYIAEPDPDAALDALRAQDDLFDTDSELLILRSRAIDVKGDHQQAVEIATRALDAAETVGELRHWFLHMEAIFEEQSEMIGYVDRMNSSDYLMPAYTVHSAAFQAYDRSRHKDLIKKLQGAEGAVRKFASEDGNTATLVALYRILGQLSYGQEDFIAAEDAFAKGVELLPNDMEFNNNLAYTRAKYLNDLEGALGPAEKAVSLSPANSPALDTLGWIYYRLGRLGQAKQRITRAMQNAEAPIERGGAYLHMAQILLAEGDRPEARKYAELANDVIKQNPYLGVEFDTDFKALMTELQEAENTQ